MDQRPHYRAGISQVSQMQLRLSATSRPHTVVTPKSTDVPSIKERLSRLRSSPDTDSSTYVPLSQRSEYTRNTVSEGYQRHEVDQKAHHHRYQPEGYSSTWSQAAEDQTDYSASERSSEADLDWKTKEERQNPAVHLEEISSKNRDAREAFLRGDGPAPGTKVDPTTRDRPSKDDGEGEKKRYKPGPGVMTKPTKDVDGYVGFANLPNQVYRKAVKKGFEFTLMVVGESGLGKSTLINSLFLTDLYNSEFPGPSIRTKKTLQVETNQVLLKEGGVQLRLTVVDTPGFGDAVDNSNSWSPIIEHIESRYEEYLNAESQVQRKAIADQRVHCCLYFISPNGHGLKPLDIEFMRRLHDKVNVIPLIAKADTMTPDECRDFKKTILNEIAQHKIKIYEFPDSDEDEENKILKKLKERVPFAVIGSNTVVDIAGRKVRGRVYPWGTVEVENLDHNDFIALRNMLIRTHMQDLKEVTNNVHYENYRYSKLSNVTGDKNKTTSKNPMLQMEEEKKEHAAKMKKMEAEMEQVFEMKVKEKQQKLKDSEMDLQRRAEQMKKQLEQQERELSEKWKMFEGEQTNWETEEEDRKRSNEAVKKKKGGLF